MATNSIETAAKRPARRETTFTLRFGALVAGTLVLYSLVSRFVPPLTRHLSYRVLILGMLAASAMPLLVFVLRDHPTTTAAETTGVSSIVLLKEARISLAFLCVVAAYVMATFAWPWLFTSGIVRMLVLSAAFILLLSYYAIAKIARRMEINLVIFAGLAGSDRLMHRFFTSLGIFLFFPLYIVIALVFPSLPRRPEPLIVFSGMTGACLIGLWSVSKDVRELGNILEKASEVARGDLNERIETPRSGELADLANAFNIVLAERNETIKELEEANERAEDLARRIQRKSMEDELTGVYNRRYFQKKLKEEIQRAEREGRRVALAVLDVDNFKEYNDTFGHPAGDELLRTLTQIIHENIRSSDTLCRYGGDEFTVVLPDTGGHSRMTREKGIKVVERVRQKVAEHAFANAVEDQGHVTMSAGLAIYPEDADDVEGVLRRADRMLYKAKRAGKNRQCGGPK